MIHPPGDDTPEQRDYPSDEDFPGFRDRFGPRGVIRSSAEADGTHRDSRIDRAWLLVPAQASPTKVPGTARPG